MVYLMRTIKRIGIISLIMMGIVGGLGKIGGVSAQEGGIGLSISPLTFELTANPGDVLTNIVKIYNPTQNTISVKVEAEDFKTVGETGQVIVTSPEEESGYSLRKWIRVEPETFTLEPDEQKFVNFIIEVPENAEPGGKYGSILASITGVMGEGATGAAIVQRVGVLLLLTVSGQVKEDLQIKEFSAPSFLEYGPAPFLIRFENTGTVHVRPRGFVSIVNWRGKKVIDIEFSQLNVIPGAIRKIEVKWNEKWLFGKYTATLVGSYGTANIPLNPSVLNFWVIPWKIAGGTFLALLLIFFFFYKTRKRWQMAIKILFKGESVIRAPENLAEEKTLFQEENR